MVVTGGLVYTCHVAPDLDKLCDCPSAEAFAASHGAVTVSQHLLVCMEAALASGSVVGPHHSACPALTHVVQVDRKARFCSALK